MGPPRGDYSHSHSHSHSQSHSVTVVENGSGVNYHAFTAGSSETFVDNLNNDKHKEFSSSLSSSSSSYFDKKIGKMGSTILKLVRYLFFLALIDLICTILMGLMMFDFDYQTLWDSDMFGGINDNNRPSLAYHVKESVLDIGILSILRWLFNASLICCLEASPNLYEKHIEKVINKNCNNNWLLYAALFIDLSSFLLLSIKTIPMGFGKTMSLGWHLYIFTFIIVAFEVLVLIKIIVVKRHREKKYYDSLQQDGDNNLTEVLIFKEGQDNSYEKKNRMTFIQLIKILKPFFLPKGYYNKLRAFSTYVFVITAKYTNVIAPLYIAVATTAIQDGQRDKAFKNIALFALYSFVPKFLNECQRMVYYQVKRVANVEISEASYTHILHLSINWHLNKKIGSLMKSMDRGVDAAETVVNYLFIFLLPTIFEAFAVAIVFWAKFKSMKLAVLCITIFIVYAIVTIKMTLWRRKLRELTNKKDNESHEVATDALVNYETVKAFSAEAYEIQRYKQKVLDYQRHNQDTLMSLSALNLTQEILINSTILCGLMIAADAVVKGEMTVGDFVAVNVYIMKLFAPLSYLGTIYGAIVRALTDMQNLHDILSEKSDVNDIANAKDIIKSKKFDGCEIEFNDISFNYPSQPIESGIKNVSFHVKAGTTTAIVGHTGSGKSTIGKLLYRFYDLKGGRILIDQQDIKMYKQKSVRNLIGIVPQDTVMFNESILYNITYGKRDATMTEVETAAAAAQVLNFVQSLPEGWNTIVGERGLKLSGGEKQRIAVARCLLSDFPIVLLDEATSALDTKTEKSLQVALNDLSRGRTTITIAHRLSTIKNADQIVVLDKGRVVEVGTHNELLAKNGSFKEMWDAQLFTGNEERE